MPHEPNAAPNGGDLLESYVIDRIEDGAWAVLEDPHGRTIDLPRAWLPTDAEEGTTVRIEVVHEADGSSTHRWTIDVAAGRERSERIRSLRDALKRAPSGDLDL